jgi:hypothetical protein
MAIMVQPSSATICSFVRDAARSGYDKWNKAPSNLRETRLTEGVMTPGVNADLYVNEIEFNNPRCWHRSRFVTDLVAEHILRLKYCRPGDDTRADLTMKGSTRLTEPRESTTHSKESCLQLLLIQVLQQLRRVVTWTIIVRNTPNVLSRANGDIRWAHAATACPPASTIRPRIRNEFWIRQA